MPKMRCFSKDVSYIEIKMAIKTKKSSSQEDMKKIEFP